jgi:hypothetical protein
MNGSKLEYHLARSKVVEEKIRNPESVPKDPGGLKKSTS